MYKWPFIKTFHLNSQNKIKISPLLPQFNNSIAINQVSAIFQNNNKLIMIYDKIQLLTLTNLEI